ncbi:N-acetyltransferase [Bifidobacterium sp. ESL0704]|uniref:GNAT family N-acetyltransferase n=1 Tax=Bifidobacterium sp. ESL0704 TaxID=2983219 RepID=UPI0023F6E2E9|nr:N-acetyltransferase [Bifidobacterium sp. ESL0704]WEV53577.1 N-acetyltransferase [Bifidobacterium sp. ESL0704]
MADGKTMEDKNETGKATGMAKTAGTAGVLTGSMRVRRASEADFEAIMRIFERARELMRNTGNPNQWGKSWPPAELIHEDIRLGRGMLLVDTEGEGGAERLLAYFAMCLGAEPTYAHLTEGAWLDDDEYVTMHRLASSGLKGHSGGACMQWAAQTYKNVRCDTHPDNLAMQHVFEKSGYRRCGIITVSDMGDRGNTRIVYQRHDR